ncbi:MAG: hypothetical protein ACRC2R_15640 [Xenococcaceae cyanobacterium]
MSNNCEMFAWYVITGKHYSGQTQEKIHKTIGAIAISVVQPVTTIRSIDTYKLEQAITKKLNEDLNVAIKAKLELEQAARDEFWRKHHAGLFNY